MAWLGEIIFVNILGSQPNWFNVETWGRIFVGILEFMISLKYCFGDSINLETHKSQLMSCLIELECQNLKCPLKSARRWDCSIHLFSPLPHCQGSLVWPMLEYHIWGNPSPFMLRAGQNHCRSPIYNSKWLDTSG